MIPLAIYTLAALGLAYIVGHSVISRSAREWLWEIGEAAPPVRWLVMLIECPACFGFWIGLAVGALGGVKLKEHGALVTAIVFALYTAGSNLVLGKLTGIMPLPSQQQPED